MELEMDIQKYSVKGCPDNIFYIPEYITKEEEELLLNTVYSAPKPKWTQLAHRKLQNWGGLPHPKGMVAEDLPQWLQKYTDKLSQLSIFSSKAPNHVLVNEYLPGQGIMPHEDGPLFHPVVSTISLGSHTLLDFYHHRDSVHQHEQEKITDPPNGASKTDCIDDSHRNQSEENDCHDDRHFLSLLLEPRSLVLVSKDMYTNHLHGIAERSEDIVTERIANLSSLAEPVSVGQTLTRGTRVSLTIRHVPRTVKAKFLFGRR